MTEKGGWLTCDCKSYPGSEEVMRVGAWGLGHLQSSAASPRRLGTAGLEDSVGLSSFACSSQLLKILKAKCKRSR